jgi:hypothetical protein
MVFDMSYRTRPRRRVVRDCLPIPTGSLIRTLILILIGVVIVTADPAAAPAAEGDELRSIAAAAAIEVVCRPVDGEPVSGGLLRLDDRSIVIALPSGETTLPISRIRTLERVEPRAKRDETPPAARITLVSGGSLVGADLEVAGVTARVATGPATIELPTAAIASVEFGFEDAGRPAKWLAEAPRAGEAEADLVVVGTGESHEFVECVIAGVSKSTVDVVLDGDAIAVKRSKVLGLKWLRPAAVSAGAIRLSSTAGAILAGPPRLEGDMFLAAIPGAQTPPGRSGANDVRLPAALFTGIDYAAGRSTSLVTTDWLEVRVEPLLGALAAFEDLSAAFRPRRVNCRLGDDRLVEGLRLVPRTTVSWEIPRGATRLRAILRPVRGLLGAAASEGAGAGSTAGVPEGGGATGRLIASIDGQEVLSTTVSGEKEIDVDVSGGRTLSVVCDYPERAADGPEGISGSVAPFGGGVVLIEPRLDQ